MLGRGPPPKNEYGVREYGRGHGGYGQRGARGGGRAGAWASRAGSSFHGRGRGPWSGGWKGGRGGFGGRGSGPRGGSRPQGIGASEWQLPSDRAAEANRIDAMYGYESFTEGAPRNGWLVNSRPCTLEDPDSGRQMSAMHYFFVEEDGRRFRATVAVDPYLYVLPRPGHERDVESGIKRTFSKNIKHVALVGKEDLNLPNHLAGMQRPYLRVTFWHTSDLVSVRRPLLDAARRAKRGDVDGGVIVGDESSNAGASFLEHVIVRPGGTAAAGPLGGSESPGAPTPARVGLPWSRRTSASTTCSTTSEWPSTRASAWASGTPCPTRPRRRASTQASAPPAPAAVPPCASCPTPRGRPSRRRA